MFATLEDVIEYYNEPSKFVSNSINTDKALLKPLGLTQREKKTSLPFLKPLQIKNITGKDYKPAKKPDFYLTKK